VVTAGSSAECDVGISGGRISQLGGSLRGSREIDAAGALDSARRARARGLPVFVETRPLYLYLTSELLREPDGAKYIGCPPLREPADVEAMGSGLADGSIHTLGSDHAPWSLRDKIDASLDVTTARPGVADLETILPMLFSAGVRTGRISLSARAASVPSVCERVHGRRLLTGRRHIERQC
jgi:dihydropyrimidinase